MLPQVQAAAYFISTEKGKNYRKKQVKHIKLTKKNPSEYRQKAKDKATEYTDLAVDTFNDYKENLNQAN